MRSELKSQRGFTIIEILVVLAIMAGFFSIVSNVFRTSFQSESRRFGRQLQGVIKFYYNQAILTGKTYRLVVSFPAGEGQPPITVEVAEGPFVRAAKPEDGDEVADEKEIVPDEEAESSVESDDGDMEGTAPKPPPMPTFVSPTKANFTPVVGGIGASTKIPKRVLLRRACVPGEEKPIEEGPIHIYFYPNGSMDAVTIVFGNDDESKLMVLATNPITGMTDVRRELPKEGPCGE